jgi:Cu/Ag efflux protein CusF
MTGTLRMSPRCYSLVVIAILAATLLIGGASQAYAQAYPQGTQGAAGTTGLAEGKIKSVDDSGRMLTLEDGTMLTIPPSAQVRQDLLREGAIVKASFEEKDGQKVVTSIEVQPGM